MAWTITASDVRLGVLGSGRWQIDAWGSHTCRSPLNADSHEIMDQLNRLKAIVGIYEKSHESYESDALRVCDDDQPLLSLFALGKVSSIAIVDPYEDAVGFGIYGGAEFFAQAKDLFILGAQLKRPVTIGLDFKGFGRTLKAFMQRDYLEHRSIAATVSYLGLSIAEGAN